MEVKIILFLYLMSRRVDYGWNIALKFREAIAIGKWTDRRGLGDLKYENKVEAALKNMEQNGLILKYSQFKEQIPDSYFLDSKEDPEIFKNPRRIYYTVNPGVFMDITVNSNKFDEKWESTPYYELGLPVDIRDYYNERVTPHYVINHGLRFIQDYQKKDLEVIELINSIPKFDYLTVLTTMIFFWESSCLHYPTTQDDDNERRDKNRGLLLSRSFFEKEKKFSKLVSKYVSGGIFNDFNPFYREFHKLIGELLQHEVYFERVCQKII